MTMMWKPPKRLETSESDLERASTLRLLSRPRIAQARTTKRECSEAVIVQEGVCSDKRVWV